MKGHAGSSKGYPVRKLEESRVKVYGHRLRVWQTGDMDIVWSSMGWWFAVDFARDISHVKFISVFDTADIRFAPVIAYGDGGRFPPWISDVLGETFWREIYDVMFEADTIDQIDGFIQKPVYRLERLPNPMILGPFLVAIEIVQGCAGGK